MVEPDRLCGTDRIDSRTSVKFVARQVAQRLGLPFAERAVFLDNQQDPQFVKEQIEKLIQTAQLEGKAVGIAHPYEVTHRVPTNVTAAS